MKINNIGLYYYKSCAFVPKIKPEKQINFCSNEGQCAFKANELKAEFEKQKIEQEYEERKQYIKFLCSVKHKVTLDEYEDVIQNQPFILKLAKKDTQDELKLKEISTSPKTIAMMANYSKELLDKRYGNNYRIISIGTSPAVLCEAMEYLGCEVVYMPISSLNRYHIIKKDKYPPNLKKSLDYLKTKGVNKKQSEQDEKINIVIDYKASGRTLSTICRCLREYNEIKRERVIQTSLAELLCDVKNTYESPYSNEGEIAKAMRNIIHDATFQNSEKICSVPHFYINDKVNENVFCIKSKGKTNKQLFKQFDEFTKARARAFEICVIDEIKKLKNAQKKSEIIPD